MELRSIPDMTALHLRLSSIIEEISEMAREIGHPATNHPVLRRPEEKRRKAHDAAELAERLYADRRRRGRHFPASLFGEPAWDILLDLFIATERGRDISVTSACIAADVPSTTGLRWLHILENEGLVTSEADAQDGRRRFIRLTRKGYQQTLAYLDATLAADCPERAPVTKEKGFFADWL